MKIGIIISGVAFIIFLIYVIAFARRRKKQALIADENISISDNLDAAEVMPDNESGNESVTESDTEQAEITESATDVQTDTTDNSDTSNEEIIQ